MNLPKMISELQAERDRIDQAILALERLSAANAKRRARAGRWNSPLTSVRDESESAESPVDSDLVPS
jgi:hypothetical protein